MDELSVYLVLAIKLISLHTSLKSYKIPLFIDMKDWPSMEFKTLDLEDKHNNAQTLEIVNNILKVP